MYHIDLINGGERNYTAITGPTGPLVSVPRGIPSSLFHSDFAFHSKVILQVMSKSTSCFTDGLHQALMLGWRNTYSELSTSTAYFRYAGYTLVQAESRTGYSCSFLSAKGCIPSMRYDYSTIAGLSWRRWG